LQTDEGTGINKTLEPRVSRQRKRDEKLQSKAFSAGASTKITPRNADSKTVTQEEKKVQLKAKSAGKTPKSTAQKLGAPEQLKLGELGLDSKHFEQNEKTQDYFRCQQIDDLVNVKIG